jgi:hypothetical protein
MDKVQQKQSYFAGALVAASFFAAMSLSPAFAAYNGAILSEIEINPYHGESYQVTVKTDKNIPMEKQVNSDNEIVLELKNTKPAQFVNTVYNNSSRVDHVIIQPESNEVKVILHGLNMAASKISLNTSGSDVLGEDIALNLNKSNSQPVTEEPKPATQDSTDNTVQSQTPQDNQETIVVNHPLENFKPAAIYDDSANSDEEDVTEIPGLAVLKKIFNTKNLDWILRLSFLALIIIGAVKLFSPKNKNVKIDLTQDVRKREVDLLKSITEKRDLIGGSGLKDNTRPIGLSKKSGYSSVSSYGLKEYQNSQLPPSSLNTGSPVRRSQTESRYNRITPTESLLKSLKEENQSQKTASRTINTSRITDQDINTAKVNVNNKKFLETMAVLYERSGRPDLAYGIKQNIMKSR